MGNEVKIAGNGSASSVVASVTVKLSVLITRLIIYSPSRIKVLGKRNVFSFSQSEPSNHQRNVDRRRPIFGQVQRPALRVQTRDPAAAVGQSGAAKSPHDGDRVAEPRGAAGRGVGPLHDARPGAPRLHVQETAETARDPR